MLPPSTMQGLIRNLGLGSAGKCPPSFQPGPAPAALCLVASLPLPGLLLSDAPSPSPGHTLCAADGWSVFAVVISDESSYRFFERLSYVPSFASFPRHGKGETEKLLSKFSCCYSCLNES